MDEAKTERCPSPITPQQTDGAGEGAALRARSGSLHAGVAGLSLCARRALLCRAQHGAPQPGAAKPDVDLPHSQGEIPSSLHRVSTLARLKATVTSEN